MIPNPVRTPGESDGRARAAHALPPSRSRPRSWRQRRWQIIVGGTFVLLLLVILMAQRSSPPPAAAPPNTSAALVAHGKILPSQQARVGTQLGGVVRQLEVSPGDQVSDRAEIARVESSAGTEVVTAPFPGVVTNVLVHEGDTLTPGAVLTIVADLRTLQVETSDVDEFLVSNVRVGQSVRVTVDTLDNLVLQGTVKSVAGLPQTDASGGQNYPVVIALSGVPSQVRAGMSIRVTFPSS